MVRAMTYQERQDHPRRCQARRHDGQPCGRFAIVGGTVCTTHGGAAPQVRRKALLRRMLELDQKAQGEAAFNVLLPPELHPLVSGGGRGHKKAPAQPTSNPAPASPAPDPRQQKRHPFVIDTELLDAAPAPEPPVGPPHRAVDEMRGPFPTDDDDRDFASPTGPQLTTLEEAVTEQARARTRAWRASGRRF